MPEAQIGRPLRPVGQIADKSAYVMVVRPQLKTLGVTVLRFITSIIVEEWVPEPSKAH